MIPLIFLLRARWKKKTFNQICQTSEPIISKTTYVYFTHPSVTDFYNMLSSLVVGTRKRQGQSRRANCFSVDSINMTAWLSKSTLQRVREVFDCWCEYVYVCMCIGSLRFGHKFQDCNDQSRVRSSSRVKKEPRFNTDQIGTQFENDAVKSSKVDFLL